LQTLLAYSAMGLLLTALAGLAVRGKWRASVTFFVYLTAVTGFGAAILANPSINTPGFWLVKQGIYDALLFALSIEIGVSAVAGFPGLANRAKAWLALIVLASTGFVFVMTPTAGYAEYLRYQPAVTTAGIWCLTSVALIIVWYQLPVAPMQRAILLAYVPYLVVFVVVTDLTTRLGWTRMGELSAVRSVAYLVATAYWAYAAWRKE
jgi:hypothetical protein